MPVNMPIRSEIAAFAGEPDAMKTPQVRPRQTSQKYSNELNSQRHVRKRRRRGDQHDGAENAADGRKDDAGAERDLALTLAGHGIGFIRVGRRGRRSGIRSRAPGISPAKIAIAEQVTIMAKPAPAA